MRKTIVVVDDFRNTRSIVVNSLEKEGFIVLEAVDGLEGLKLFDGKEIDLLVTDLNMPNLDGLELAAEIKTIPQYRFIPILILSTETSKEMKQKAKEIGVTGWVQKPFQINRFMMFINKVLR